jgi:hypothetical protein
LKQTGTTVEVDEAGGGVEGGSSGAEGGSSAEGGAEGGGGKNSAAWRQEIFFRPALGFCIIGVTHFIPGVLFVSTDIVQPIPKMLFVVSADGSQPIPIIFCVGWITSADTNKAQPINKLSAHHCFHQLPQW